MGIHKYPSAYYLTHLVFKNTLFWKWMLYLIAGKRGFLSKQPLGEHSIRQHVSKSSHEGSGVRSPTPGKSGKRKVEQISSPCGKGKKQWGADADILGNGNLE